MGDMRSHRETANTAAEEEGSCVDPAKRSTRQVTNYVGLTVGAIRPEFYSRFEP